VREKVGEEVANIPWLSKESGLAALQLTTSATRTEGLHDVEVLLTHQSCCKPAASCPHLQWATQHQALSVYEYSYKIFSGDRKKEVLVSPRLGTFSHLHSQALCGVQNLREDI